MSTVRQRFDLVDAFRGVAIVWMTVFHFFFDLNQFGYIKQNFYTDTFWTYQRAAIVSLFLFCAGLHSSCCAFRLAGFDFFSRFNMFASDHCW